MHVRTCTVVLLAVVLASGCAREPEKNVPVEADLAARFVLAEREVRVSEGQRRARAGIETIAASYRSPGGDEATGFVVKPVRPADDLAGIVIAHGAGGGADDFLREAREYARRGAVVLTIDSPYVRSDDEKLRAGDAELQETYDAMEQWVEDLLLGLDLLVGQYGADPGRLGLIGYSMGAQPATLAAALDARVAALVVMAGHAYPSGLPDDLMARQLFTAIDTSEFVDNLAPTSVLFQGAEFDSVVARRDLEVLHERASAPKELRWYAADHELGQVAATERVEWLAEELELSG